VPLSRNLGTLTSWNPLGLSRPVMGLLYLLHGGRSQYAPSNRWYQPTRIKGVITQSIRKSVIFHVCFLSVFIYYINYVILRLCHRNCGTEKLFRQFGFLLDRLYAVNVQTWEAPVLTSFTFQCLAFLNVINLRTPWSRSETPRTFPSQSETSRTLRLRIKLHVSPGLRVKSYVLFDLRTKITSSLIS